MTFAVPEIILLFLFIEYSRKAEDFLIPFGGLLYSMWFWSSQIDHSVIQAYLLTGAFLFVWLWLLKITVDNFKMPKISLR